MMTRIIQTHFFFVHIAEAGSSHAAVGGSIIAQNNKAAAACISEFGAWLPMAVWFASAIPVCFLLIAPNLLLDQVHPFFITISCNSMCCTIPFWPICWSDSTQIWSVSQDCVSLKPVFYSKGLLDCVVPAGNTSPTIGQTTCFKPLMINRHHTSV